MKKEKQDVNATEEVSELTDALTEENQKLIEEAELLREENAKLEKTVKRLQSSAEKSDAYLGQLVALKSDFESYKRRMKLNTEQAKQEGIASVAEKLLPIADTFEIARKQISDENTLKAFEMVYAQLVRALDEMGIAPMDVLGKDFDHMTMNALSSLDRGEENKGKVVEVYKNGYTFGEKILRYAEVVVGA